MSCEAGVHSFCILLAQLCMVCGVSPPPSVPCFLLASGAGDKMNAGMSLVFFWPLLFPGMYAVNSLSLVTGRAGPVRLVVSSQMCCRSQGSPDLHSFTRAPVCCRHCITIYLPAVADDRRVSGFEKANLSCTMRLFS